LAGSPAILLLISERNLDSRNRSGDVCCAVAHEGGLFAGDHDPAFSRHRSAPSTCFERTRVRRKASRSFEESLVQDCATACECCGDHRASRGPPYFTLAAGFLANTAISPLVHAGMLNSVAGRQSRQLYILGDSKLCDTTTRWTMFHSIPIPVQATPRGHAGNFSQLASFQTWVDSWSVRRSGSAGVPSPDWTVRLGQLFFDVWSGRFGLTDSGCGRRSAWCRRRAMRSLPCLAQYYALDPKYGRYVFAELSTGDRGRSNTAVLLRRHCAGKSSGFLGPFIQSSPSLMGHSC